MNRSDRRYCQGGKLVHHFLPQVDKLARLLQRGLLGHHPKIRAGDENRALGAPDDESFELRRAGDNPQFLLELRKSLLVENVCCGTGAIKGQDADLVLAHRALNGAFSGID